MEGGEGGERGKETKTEGGKRKKKNNNNKTSSDQMREQHLNQRRTQRVFLKKKGY